jgi:CRP-like cAMP-binding protein
MQRDPGAGVARTSWDRHEIDAFVAMAVERRYKPGQAIVRQGDPTSVHLIMRGWAKVTTTRLSGHEVLLVLQGPGDLTGHWEAVRGALSPAVASVVALEPTITMSVAAERFVEFLLAYPPACLAELRNLVNVTVGLEKRRVDLAVVDTGHRLAALLIDLAVRHGRESLDGIEIAIALSQDEISGMIGASRDSVTRALTSMRAQGLVVTGRRSVTVRDLEALRVYASSERAVS